MMKTKAEDITRELEGRLVSLVAEEEAIRKLLSFYHGEDREVIPERPVTKAVEPGPVKLQRRGNRHEDVINTCLLEMEKTGGPMEVLAIWDRVRDHIGISKANLYVILSNENKRSDSRIRRVDVGVYASRKAISPQGLTPPVVDEAKPIEEQVFDIVKSMSDYSLPEIMAVIAETYRKVPRAKLASYIADARLKLRTEVELTD